MRDSGLWIQMNFYPNPSGPAKNKKTFKKWTQCSLAIISPNHVRAHGKRCQLPVVVVGCITMKFSERQTDDAVQSACAY
jgi:hypothetical protein